MPAAIERMNPTSLPDAGQLGYSQISIAGPGRLAFVSGQVAWERDEGRVPGTLEAQAQVVLSNLAHALAALGAGTQDIVQLRIYVVNLTHDRQAQVMPSLMTFLNGAQPSITGIGVAALAGAELELEIEMVVQLPG